MTPIPVVATRLQNRPHDMPTPAESMTITRQPFGWREATLLVVGYVVLDWASYIRPLENLNITPWNPAPALAVLLLLRHGPVALPMLLVAMLAADLLVRDMHLLSVATALSLGLAAGYWAIATALARALRHAGMVDTTRELAVWSSIVVAGTLINSALFVTTHFMFELLSASELGNAMQRHWVGDVVGVLVTMPLLWVIVDERGRAAAWRFVRSTDFLIILALTAGALGIAFGASGQAAFKYLYVLFIPITVASARHDIAGAVTTIGIMQAGIIGSVQLRSLSAVTLVELQWLVLVLAMSGLFLAVVVAERERIGAELRHALRIASAGEMAAALAHELNQPLTALTAYGAACEKMIAQGAPPERVATTVRNLVAEAFRASEIVRRLRDFFRYGSSRMEPVSLGEVARDVLQQMSDRISKAGARMELQCESDGSVVGDRLQLEVVVRNLVANALDAVQSLPDERKRCLIRVASWGQGQIALSVVDSGPGITATSAELLFEPFRSTKSSGMGLGLAVSRAIAIAHGGALWAEAADGGTFRLTLPRATPTGHP